MKFYRIYIEITNVCGLRCSFCPPKNSPDFSMDLDFFESIIIQAQQYTKEVALHVVGDPLTLSSLKEYLDIIEKYHLKAMLTTSGYFFKKHAYETLFHPCVKQINISLNSFNKNDTSFSFEHYMTPILDLCQEKLQQKKELFINLRLWNLNEEMSEEHFNKEVFLKLNKTFGINLSTQKLLNTTSKSIRLASKILLHFDNYFEWPSLKNETYGDGMCQALSSHIAILSNGRVVPCCLDCDAVIELGNLHKSSLNDILRGSRAVSMVKGFKKGKATEELCQKCSYKGRFNQE